jgi:transposase
MTTKIHAAVDALGNPVALSLTAGQVRDVTQAEPLLEDLAPDAVIADKGYDTDDERKSALARELLHPPAEGSRARRDMESRAPIAGFSSPAPPSARQHHNA